MIETKIKNYRLLIILSIAVIGMFGFGFALVPFYSVMCKTLGINGKPANYAVAGTQTIDKSRLVTVEFLANTNESLDWDFYPLTKKVQLHPGANVQIKYYAKNNSSQTMTVQAVPSISPGVAAAHLKKTECFCFRQQTFKAGEEHEMPVLFHLDNQLPADINTITLSYTMFDVAKLLHQANKPVGRITS